MGENSEYGPRRHQNRQSSAQRAMYYTTNRSPAVPQFSISHVDAYAHNGAGGQQGNDYDYSQNEPERSDEPYLSSMRAGPRAQDPAWNGPNSLQHHNGRGSPWGSSQGLHDNTTGSSLNPQMYLFNPQPTYGSPPFDQYYQETAHQGYPPGIDTQEHEYLSQPAYEPEHLDAVEQHNAPWSKINTRHGPSSEGLTSYSHETEGVSMRSGSDGHFQNEHIRPSSNRSMSQSHHEGTPPDIPEPHVSSSVHRESHSEGQYIEVGGPGNSSCPGTEAAENMHLDVPPR